MKETTIGMMIWFGAAICTVCCIAIYHCLTNHISLKELGDSGYGIIRHSETHGEFHTNWLEVVHRGGRPL